MADVRRTSSGRAAEDPPQEGGKPQGSTGGSPAPADASFKEHFGEPADLQDRVVHDRTIVVERDGATVFTDAPREGDIPQSAAQKRDAEEAKP